MTDLTQTEKQAIVVAIRALRHAHREEWDETITAVFQLGAEFGGEGVALALAAWCDVLAKHLGITSDHQLTLKFRDRDTGTIGSADEVGPATAWAGQLITARMAMDRDTYDALMAALPADPMLVCDHVCAVLMGVALNLAHHQPSLP